MNSLKTLVGFGLFYCSLMSALIVGGLYVPLFQPETSALYIQFGSWYVEAVRPTVAIFSSQALVGVWLPSVVILFIAWQLATLVEVQIKRTRVISQTVTDVLKKTLQDSSAATLMQATDDLKARFMQLNEDRAVHNRDITQIMTLLYGFKNSLAPLSVSVDDAEVKNKLAEIHTFLDEHETNNATALQALNQLRTQAEPLLQQVSAVTNTADALRDLENQIAEATNQLREAGAKPVNERIASVRAGISSIEQVLANPIGDNESLEDVLATVQTELDEALGHINITYLLEQLTSTEESIRSAQKVMSEPTVFSNRVRVLVQQVEGLETAVEKMKYPLGPNEDDLEDILSDIDNRLVDIGSESLQDQITELNNISKTVADAKRSLREVVSQLQD